MQTLLFHRPKQGSDVRIIESMYNPLDGERYAFVELTNLGALPADLSGAFFQGIDFYFLEIKQCVDKRMAKRRARLPYA